MLKNSLNIDQLMRDILLEHQHHYYRICGIDKPVYAVKRIDNATIPHRWKVIQKFLRIFTGLILQHEIHNQEAYPISNL